MSLKLNRIALSLLFTFSLLSLSLSNPDFTTLLFFKHSADPLHSLSSWSNSSDHCSWLGVTCNPLTHRVTKLVLNRLNLTGSIQTLASLSHLRHLSLHHNFLSRAPNLTSWPNLKHLYLSHNNFAGKFPAGISRLRHLRRIDLSHNNFSGEIPMTELTQLRNLLTLRLEFNSFAGPLNSGKDYSLLISISDFNVSSNDLTGKIPNCLSRFPATSFYGNNELCGNPLPLNCSHHELTNNRTVGSVSVQSRPSGEQIKKSVVSDRVVLMIISIDVIAVLVTLVIVTWCCYKRSVRGYSDRERRKREVVKSFDKNNVYVVEREDEEEMVCFEGCKGFAKVDDLLKASAEMLGKGSVGTTYKAVMEGGDVVVVKRVRWRRERRRRSKEVDGLMREIGGLRHHNLVSLRAYHSSKDELLLVYDFFPNGSLHSLLHGNRGPGRTPLDWTTRLKLALGSAKGLAFLHSHNKSKLFHGHLTSSNIIVDHLGNACISDMGLHQLFPIPSSPNNPYEAPELHLNNNGNNNSRSKISQKCDVYSFGIVLLEILSGKTATIEGELASLAKWVKGVTREEWTWEVFDFELLRYKEMEQEMEALMQVALLCLDDSPRERPKMGVVSKMIEDIRTKGGRERCATPLIDDLSSDSSPSLSESTPNFTSS